MLFLRGETHGVKGVFLQRAFLFPTVLVSSLLYTYMGQKPVTCAHNQRTTCPWFLFFPSLCKVFSEIYDCQQAKVFLLGSRFIVPVSSERKKEGGRFRGYHILVQSLLTLCPHLPSSFAFCSCFCFVPAEGKKSGALRTGRTYLPTYYVQHSYSSF